MVREILKYPDPRLREHAKPVDRVDDEVKRLVDDMAETMYAAPGCGLAAPQLGIPLRVFVIDAAAENEPSDLRVFINPEILTVEGSQTWQEGCLSFPGISEEIKRGALVRVRALDATGKLFELEADGLLAVAIQHENDHLDGVLMVDKLGAIKKRMIGKKMAKLQPEA